MGTGFVWVGGAYARQGVAVFCYGVTTASLFRDWSQIWRFSGALGRNLGKVPIFTARHGLELLCLLVIEWFRREDGAIRCYRNISYCNKDKATGHAISKSVNTGLRFERLLRAVK